MTYNYIYESDARARHEDIVTDELIERLLDAKGL